MLFSEVIKFNSFSSGGKRLVFRRTNAELDSEIVYLTGIKLLDMLQDIHDTVKLCMSRWNNDYWLQQNDESYNN